MAEADPRPVLPGIGVPTLVIPPAELVVIPDAGHLCNVEAPEVFNGHASAFLTRVAAGNVSPGDTG